jgi:predicted transcriptional regulator of viral defense system
MSSKLDRAARLIRKRRVIRASEAEKAGIPREYLRRLMDSGVIVRRARGVYAAAEDEPTEHHSLAEVSRVAPESVVCLLSALAFHDLGTQMPHEVWIAIGSKARIPRRVAVQLQPVRMSGEALTAGIDVHRIEGVAVRIFGPGKTVADCFKFRNRIGLDIAVEALRTYRRNRGDLNDLWRYAEICRVTRIIRPYLEALT